MIRPRVLLFCHDGHGLGHLRRIARLASALQEDYSTLVICGMREASWIVSPECGLVILPSWDGIDFRRSSKLGRMPWIDLTTPEAELFRSKLISHVATLYKPDVTIVDYLPFGQREELMDFLLIDRSLRYLLHRGITDTADHGLLHGAATERLAFHYHRILIASDPLITNIVQDDDYCLDARAKTTYVGFIGPRHSSRLNEDTPGVVCSGGGGLGAEALMQACLSLAANYTDIPFTLVLGPHSRFSADPTTIPKNCQVYTNHHDLPGLHQGAAVVISSGGYNSVLEAASGGAHIIVHPNQVGANDEQLRFATKLAIHYPITLVAELEALGAVFHEVWRTAINSKQPPVLALDQDGAGRIREIIRRDIL